MQVNTKLKVVGHAEVHPFTYKIDADGRKVDLLVSGVNPVIRICGDKSMLIQVDGGHRLFVERENIIKYWELV